MSESVTSPGEPERWKPIPGYEDLYEISDLGRVRSFHAGRGSGKRGGLLKPWLNGTKGKKVRYPMVTLVRDSVDDKRLVHILVAEAFIGPKPPGMQTRHGPGGPLDARLVNLCYGTPSENEQDKIRDGTYQRGELCPWAKLTVAAVLEIRERYAAGETGARLGAEFGVTSGCVNDIARGRHWGLPPVIRSATGHVRGTEMHTSKLTEQIVAECRKRRATGASYNAMAREFGVTRAVMREAVLGVTWKHVA